ncbi:MAG: hypothetical protein ACLGI6_19580, partial [Gammaproteobacteria bacterium]
EARANVNLTMARFMQEAAPQAPDAVRALAGELVLTTLGALGHDFSTTPRTRAEIETYSAAVADMLCAYVAKIADEISPNIPASKT